MQLNNNVQVGNLPIDYSKKDFKTLTDNAQLVALPDNDKKEWAEMADRVTTSGQVGEDDMARLKEFAGAAGTGKTSLKSSLIQVLMDKTATKAQKNEAKAKLADVNCFTSDYTSLTEALKSATAKAAVAGLAGASFGPAGVLSAYQTYANLPEGELKEVVENIQGMRDGSAAFIYDGNKVTQAHQELLWQAMNDLHDSGVNAGKARNPVAVAGQYYELTSQQEIGKFAANAEAGNPVYLNLDPTRITPPPRGDTVQYDDGPDKLRSMLQLLDAGCAVSSYPCEAMLGDAADLMHRKGLQVGDQFLLSGMNANEGSGENIDRGYILEGPAAHRKGQDFIRDVNDSFAYPTLEDRYGAKNLEGFPNASVTMGVRGLTALLDASSQDGPAPAGTDTPRPKSFEDLAAYATSKGFNLADIVDASAADLPGQIDTMLKNHHEPIHLSKQGKQMVLDLQKKVNDRINAPENKAKFDTYQAPSDAAAGKTTVVLADIGTERQATCLETIQGAQKFIDAPTFVITRPIAAAISEKAKEMKEAGLPFDVRLTADSGVYPDGSTPNKTGVMLLEDAGLRPRWTLLPRSGSHDRKIHAKDILTDQAEWFGSTNLSGKGMRENWEHSGVVKFDDKQADLVANRKHAEELFNELWDHMSFECNTIDVATNLVKNKFHYKGRDLESEINRSRGKVVDELIANLEEYEKQSGAVVCKAIDDNPKIQANIEKLMASGMDEGSARLISVVDDMGKDNFYASLAKLPAMKTLNDMVAGQSAGSSKPTAPPQGNAPAPAPSGPKPPSGPAGPKPHQDLTPDQEKGLAWLQANAEKNTFAASLLKQFQEKGSLSPKQWECAIHPKH